MYPNGERVNHDDWYKDAVIYQLHVKAFADSNGDGVGDLEGLRSKLDYLCGLGVTCLWLLPFYPSPLRDDGYDISDYKRVNPAYGTMREFHRFVKAAHERGLRVITELVLNHTSDRHPWFQRAREAKPGSAWRDFYVWSDTDEKYAGTRIIFTDTETSNWTWDPVAKQYYWHRFFSHQPDLNFDNPRVIEAMLNVMRFWLEAGVDGLRLDAVPYLCERDGTSNENLPETHAIVKILRAIVEHEFPGRIFLGEANQWPEDLSTYFGDGDECHMCFHFPLMPRLFMAVAEEDRYPIYDIMRQTPPIPPACQWALFLRNHDELTLEMVSDREREYLRRTYASDPRALLNMGIRRRLAPLMENDRRKIELLNGILMSLPGTPIIYYGDEIAMGDNVFLGDRNGVRTPMQWSADRNGGFSTADPAQLYLPPIMDAVYGYAGVNVEAQTRSPSSLLNWMKRLIAIRKSTPVFGRGSLGFLYPANRHILAYLREYGDEVVLCVANLAQAPQAVQLDLSRHAGRFPVEMFGPSIFPVISAAPYTLTLPGFSFYWFSLAADVTAPRGQPQAPALMPELTTLVLPRGAVTIADRARADLAEDVLPRFIERQAWSDEQGAASARLDDLFPLAEDGRSMFFAIAHLRSAFAIGLEATFGDAPALSLVDRAVARLRSGAREGFLVDVTAQPDFAVAVVKAMREERTLQAAGELAFCAEEALRELPVAGEPRVQTDEGDPEEALFVLEDQVRVRIYRRPQRERRSELDMCRRLIDAGFEHVLPIAGSAVYREAGGEREVVAIAQQTPSIRGNGWHLARAHLDQLLRMRPGEELEQSLERTGTQSAVLGALIARFHRTVADPANAGFEQEPLTAEALAGWQADARKLAERMVERLATARADMPGPTGEAVDRLLANLRRLDEQLAAPLSAPAGAVRSRIHGDLHLGNILVAGEAFFIDGFVETEEPLSSPLRDVAAALTSIRDAAASAVLEASANPAEEAANAEQIVAVWKRNASLAFLAGYDRAIGGCDRASVAFFRAERSVRDVIRELDRRSTWLRVAVRGLLEELDGV